MAKKRSVPEPESRSIPGQRSSVLGKAVLMAAVILLVFWPALRGGWIWDDTWYLPDNPLLRDASGLWKIWFEPGSWVEYYPIEATVLWGQWHLWGNDTLGYHLTNVALHFLGALLVWRLLDKLGMKLAWLGGLIFAVHPVQVESVAYIAELKNTLSLPPFLLALMAWIDFEEHRRKRDYLLALGLFLVAMLCKITMAPFPVLILLYTWWKRGRIRWDDLKVTVPFFLIALELGMNTIWTGEKYQEQSHALPDVIPLGGGLSRLACAGTTLAFYFMRCFSPSAQLPIYPQWQVDPPRMTQLWPWIILAGVGYLCWKKRNSWGKHALLGLGFFVLFLAPFLGFLPVSYMSFTWVMDHFLYLPIIGLIGLGVVLLEGIEGRLPDAFRMPLLAVAAVMIALLGWRSHDYAAKFASSEELWTYTIAHNPSAWPAYQNLGAELMRTGDATRALPFFEETVRLQPGYAEAFFGMGNALKQLGRTREALAQYAKALQLNPQYAAAYLNMGGLLLRQGRAADAVMLLQQAAQLDPDVAMTHYSYGQALLQTGRYDEAIDEFNATIHIKPNLAQAYDEKGVALGAQGQTKEAISHFKVALRFNPGLVEAHDNLGISLEEMQQIPEAIAQFEQALKLRPGDAKAREHLDKLRPRSTTPVIAPR